MGSSPFTTKMHQIDSRTHDLRILRRGILRIARDYFSQRLQNSVEQLRPGFSSYPKDYFLFALAEALNNDPPTFFTSGEHPVK